MNEKLHQGGGGDDKHESARNMAEAAMRAETAGDSGQADALLEQAAKADPSAVIDVVTEHGGKSLPITPDDTELSAASETVVPGSDAPSRAGISGSGSGADNQGM